MSQPHEHKSIYDLIGPAAFEALVAAFYRQVSADPVLRPMYPDADMDGAERRLRMFLVQYFGGPDSYSQERGHPRLRMRHMPFAIGQAERAAWMKAMRAALREANIPEPALSMMHDYFEKTAMFMMNQPVDGIDGILRSQ